MERREYLLGDRASAGERTIEAAGRNRALDIGRNGAAIALMWVLYSLARSFSQATDSVALANARAVRAFQERVGIGIEAELQQLVLTEPVALFANSYYLLHFPVTIALVVIAFLRSRDHVFPILRDGLVVMTVAGLAVYVLFPLAPPRLLNGVVDASVVYGPNPYSLPGTGAANQLAAMPSMHVAWAVALSWVLFRVRSRLWLGIMGIVHPLITVFIVLVTGHHFLVDVLAGAFVGIAAIAAVSNVHSRAVVGPEGASANGGTPEAFHTLSTG